MISTSPEEASTRLFTMAGPTATIAPPAAACFSRVRREKSRTARCVFSPDVSLLFLVTLVLPKSFDVCAYGAAVGSPSREPGFLLSRRSRLRLTLAVAVKTSQDQLRTVDGARRARTGSPPMDRRRGGCRRPAGRRLHRRRRRAQFDARRL